MKAPLRLRSGQAARVEFLCVGTELLSGRLNTHVPYVAGVLAPIGLGLSRETSLPDEQGEIRDAVRDALTRADVVLISGGLGPTFDDLTREGVSEALGKKLVVNDRIIRRLERLFRLLKRPMPPANRRQAEVVEGARVLDNGVGSAPGQLLCWRAGGRMRTVVLLPGPFRELSPLLEGPVLEHLKATYSRGRQRRKLVLLLEKVPESVADERLRPILAAHKDAEFTILASPGRVEIHATVQGRDPAALDRRLARIRKALVAKLGEFVYAEGSSEGKQTP